MQIIEKKAPVYDAVVVGSGATGGWVAKTLSEAGMKVLVLEAGPKITDADFTEHVQPYQLKYRGRSPEIARNRPIQAMKYACRESNYHWFVDDVRNPYTTPADRPFQWTRCRILGGRTLTWGRLSWRLAEYDFKPRSHDGYGVDWPISYEDVAPYYDRIEGYVGISGSREGLAQVPDGQFLPAMRMNCGERYFKKTVEAKAKRPVIMGRTAIVTQQHNGRAACHYCGPCEQGCVTHSYFSSLWTTLVDAQKTGNCTVETGAVVSHVTTDPDTGRANGVAYIDQNTRAAREARGKLVVLCASTLESTRILLNSGDGFANSSGVVGRYVMDHIAGSISGDIGQTEPKHWTGSPRRPVGLYLPRMTNLDRPHTNGVLRGYGMQGGHGFSYGRAAAASLPGFGQGFKQSVIDNPGHAFRITAYAECLPYYDNRVTLDPEVTDAWGIPALHIDAKWGANEMHLYKMMLDEAEELLTIAGAKHTVRQRDPRWPGGATHELGTCRMGDDPRTSALNGFCQSHDVPNLFVTDGAAFPSSACQNPTLTMMALSLRASEYMLEQAKRGAV